MSVALFLFVLFLFTAISWLCFRACKAKNVHSNYGEEHRPYIDKKGLYKYRKTVENHLSPSVKDLGFPPKEYGLSKETKHQKQRSSWK